MKSTGLTKTVVILTAAASVFFTGCVSNMFPGGPTPAGVLVTSVKSPAQYLAVATEPSAGAKKTGTSRGTAVLGLVAFGDASVDTAMKNGAITKVHHVDHQVTSVLFGLWLQSTTIVHGD